MRNIWTIAKREYDNYFNSPLAYVVAFAITLFLGVLFALIMYIAAEQSLFGGPAPTNEQITWWLVFLLFLATPALTMRLLSDEARMGTLELLLTAPVRDYELVIGKWLGSFLTVLTLLLITLIYPIIMNNFISPGLDLKALLASYIGVVLVASALLALGTGISSIFSNQFAAFFATVGMIFFFWIFVPAFGNFAKESSDIFTYLGLGSHFFDTMNRGTINLGDIAYYLSLTAMGLFVGTTSIEIRRWR